MSDDLDVKDIEILKMFRKDSRTPMAFIGDKLDISKATVSRRAARMEEEGVIRNYSIDVDLSGKGIMKSLVSIQIIGSPVNPILEKLRTYPEIGHIYKTFGDHNLVCEVYTLNVDELYQMVQSKILQIPSVRNVEVDVFIEGESVDVNADIKLYEEKLTGERRR